MWLSRYGRGDVKGLLYSVSQQDYLKHTLKLVETSIWLSCSINDDARDSIVQSSIIFDMVTNIYKNNKRINNQLFTDQNAVNIFIIH